MAVITPVMIHTIRASPTELAFSRTPLGLTKIPDPMMLPETEKERERREDTLSQSFENRRATCHNRDCVRARMRCSRRREKHVDLLLKPSTGTLTDDGTESKGFLSGPRFLFGVMYNPRDTE